ncbi:hypothetical protein N658DRAFT_178616 [Parathielavia hyrcaniae]|uniref:Uncharacterized protein n=1 Tax=Parathielavia hyrcaniae TaxID=113614 RepID=A0AAN6Q6F8_9PEZI|nr:hypothetical protein N658DRAFT_178616 [Parathielavia hyrcaniae]
MEPSVYAVGARLWAGLGGLLSHRTSAMRRQATGVPLADSFYAAGSSGMLYGGCWCECGCGQQGRKYVQVQVLGRRLMRKRSRSRTCLAVGRVKALRMDMEWWHEIARTLVILLEFSASPVLSVGTQSRSQAQRHAIGASNLEAPGPWVSSTEYELPWQEKCV